MDSTSVQRMLSKEYYGLNGTHVDVLDQPPSALEFCRIARISRPVIIHNVQIPALAKWTDDYLRDALGEHPISVAVTPNGRADSVCKNEDDGVEYFVEPHTEHTSISALLADISRAGTKLRHTDPQEEEEVLYLQSQNGNLYDQSYFAGSEENPSNTCEFAALRKDVPAGLDWCSEALDSNPDAVNLWIGDTRSTTSIHSDPYENIYLVVRGSKHFTLLPPTESWALEEREYPHARWHRSKDRGFHLQPSKDTPPVRWSSISDPTMPGCLPRGTHPIHITLNAGESVRIEIRAHGFTILKSSQLYLPAGWWHYVRQGSTLGEPTIAVNWWYDVEMRGMQWVWLNFLRGRTEDSEDEEIQN